MQHTIGCMQHTNMPCSTPMQHTHATHRIADHAAHHADIAAHHVHAACMQHSMHGSTPVRGTPFSCCTAPCTHVYTHVCAHIFTHVFTHVRTHVDTRMYAHIFRAHVCTHVWTHAHTHVDTWIRAHVYLSTHMSLPPCRSELLSERCHAQRVVNRGKWVGHLVCVLWCLRQLRGLAQGRSRLA